LSLRAILSMFGASAAGLVKTRRCSRRKKPLQTALARRTVNTVQANIFAEESPK
jgi:hypothetical protein